MSFEATLAAIFDSVAERIKATLDQDTELMTREQCARYIKRDVATVDRWTRAGMPVHKPLGSNPLFYRPEVLAWVLNDGVVPKK